MKQKPLKNILLTALVVLVTTGAFAQPDVDSPYSLFGVGQLSGSAMNVRLKGMGGVGNAIYGKGLINTNNPATLAKIDSLAFLFDADALVTSIHLEDVLTSPINNKGSYYNVTYHWGKDYQLDQTENMIVYYLA